MNYITCNIWGYDKISTVIGIPRGLFFHLFNEGWVTFFKELGYEVKISSPSNKKILNAGTQVALSETCLPVKFYLGHVIELANAGVDYLFIPRMVSINNKEYLCPRFMGLPDTIEQTMSPLPPVITPTINLNNKEYNWKKAAEEVGKKLNIPTFKIFKAYIKGILEQKRANKRKQGELRQKLNSKNKTILLVGRDYILEDEITGIGIKEKIKSAGYEVITTNISTAGEIDKGSKYMDKRLYWTLNKRLFGSSLHLTHNGLINGIVQVIAFGCGPDSLVCELIERKVKEISSVPNLLLTLDEHTGEAGLYTRLEAFMDLLERRSQLNETHLSSHG